MLVFFIWGLWVDEEEFFSDQSYRVGWNVLLIVLEESSTQSKNKESNEISKIKYRTQIVESQKSKN